MKSYRAKRVDLNRYDPEWFDITQNVQYWQRCKDENGNPVSFNNLQSARDYIEEQKKKDNLKENR